MSDTATPANGSSVAWGSPEQQRITARRHAADKRLQFYGLGAIGLAILLLGILVASLVRTGYVSFVQSKVSLEIPLSAERIDPKNPEKANYRVIVRNAFRDLFPNIKNNKELRHIDKILSSEARFIVRDYVVANPDMIGKTVTFDLPLSDPFDQLHKKVIPSEVEALDATRDRTVQDACQSQCGQHRG